MPQQPTGVILISDDEPHIRHIVGSKLRAAGFTVLEANNGKDALALAIEHLPDLIVTDFQMPVMSGFEMSQQLASNPETSEIPIILLTARGHKLTPTELATANIQVLVNKPFSPRELLETVREQLPLHTR